MNDVHSNKGQFHGKDAALVEANERTKQKRVHFQGK